jgi:DegV family protein with EDD domain
MTMRGPAPGALPFSTRGWLPGRVWIVTDSASDLLPSHAQALGIAVVPHYVILDGTRWRDGIDLTASEFYARLPHVHGPLFTEPASAQDLYHAYQRALSEGATAIVSVHVSSRLSQVVAHAQAAAEALAPAPIYVLDSRQAGIGMWTAVIQGAQLANAGAPVQAIGERMRALLSRPHLYFMVESLEYLRRGGRIGRARELLGTLVDAHPILTIDQGEVALVETVRQRGRALQRVRELALAGGSLESLLICGTSIESIAQVETLLREQYRGAIQKTWLGPTLGAHTGPGVAIAVVRR